MHPPDLLLLCRPEFTDTLGEELAPHVTPPATLRRIAPGLIGVDGATALPVGLFERQRLVAPAWLPAAALRPVAESDARAVLGIAAAEHPLWTVHLMTHERETPESEDAAPGGRKLDGIWQAILRAGRRAAPDLEKRYRPPHRLKPGGWVIQVLLTDDGLWHSRERIETMHDPRPGGYSRMRFDPLAPSRSYLKMEEALEWFTPPPQPGQRVIDLGAAPGGWTYAFIKRGAEVLAIDHGPMKLPPPQPGWGTCHHRRENGITFEPPADWNRVDWLVADMLIAPGVALGLLRRWLADGRADRIVCNIKLPQEHPLGALTPVLDLLARHPEYRSTVRQLYHDRREVTVLADRRRTP